MTWNLPDFLPKTSLYLVVASLNPIGKKICASHNWIEIPEGFGVKIPKQKIFELRPPRSCWIWSFCGHHPPNRAPPHLRIHCIGVHPGRRSKGTWDCQGRWFFGRWSNSEFCCWEVVGGPSFLVPICKLSLKRGIKEKMKTNQVFANGLENRTCKNGTFSKCHGMDCFGTYFTHVQNKWCNSCSKCYGMGLLRYILCTCPKQVM